MFRNFYRLAAVCALALFAHAQQQGWNLFEDTANARSGGSGGSGRVYHK